MAALARVFNQKWVNPPKTVDEDFSGRNIIVTGATSGIGKEAAYKFAALGASKVVLAARDREKGEATKAALEARLSIASQLEVWELDMMSYDSIMAFAKQANELDHLDIVVLNAGVWRVPYVLSMHGWEEDIQANTLSTTLLAILLLPKLRESKRESGRIPFLEFVNSGLHQSAVVPLEVRERPNILDYYNDRKNFGEGSSYKFSKVFLMYATQELANLISSEHVIITSVCPGWTKTELGRDHNFPGLYLLVFLFIFLFMRTPEQASNTILSGVSKGESLHGRFWQHDEVRPIPPSLAGREMKELGSRMWSKILDSLKNMLQKSRKHLLPPWLRNKACKRS